MIKKLNVQEIDGIKVPLRCDNFVLAQIQEEYETLNNFEMQLLGLSVFEIDGKIQKNEKGETQFLKGEPSLKAIQFALPMMMGEGFEYAKEVGEQLEPVNIKKFMRELVVDMDSLSKIIHDEFVNSVVSKN